MASTTRLWHSIASSRISPAEARNLHLHLHTRTLQHHLSPRATVQTRSSSPSPIRAFSTSPAWKRRNGFVPKAPQMRQPAQRSMKVALEEQKQKAELPDDVGLLPGTFIMPASKNLPSLLSRPKDRLKLERARLTQRLKDLFPTAAMKFWYIRDPTRKPPFPFSSFKRTRTWFRYPHLQRTRIASIAKHLYEDMYTHFSKGTVDAAKNKLCESVHANLLARCAARPPNTSMRWTLHRYLATPSVVSHRIVPLTLEKDKYKQSALQQAVVRISSMQSLQRVKKVKGRDGKVAEVIEDGSTSGEGREVTELFVVQRMLRKGTWGDWKAWGTTEETTLEKLQHDK